jgi:phage terminase small subunit
MPLKSGRLTPQETVFVERYARTNDARYAAEKAGYSPRSIAARASENANDPAILAHVARLRRSMLQTASIEAVDVLIEGMRDEKAPRQARTNAATAVLKYATAEIADGGAKELHEMSAAELAAALARVKARDAAAEARGAAVDVEPLEPSKAPDVDLFA